MELSYYVAINGEVRGPYVAAQIRGMWQTGAITADAQVCIAGEEDWMPVDMVVDEPRSGGLRSGNALADEARRQQIAFQQYEVRKKSVGLGVLFGILMPGGGSFYAGNFWSGVVQLLLPLFGLMLGGSRNPGVGSLGMALLSLGILIWVLSPFMGASAVSDYNRQLRRELGV